MRFKSYRFRRRRITRARISATATNSDSGIALAAPQIGVQKQIVVWDIDDQPMALINPVVVESDGEWVYSEGCLSIPDLYVDILRPNQVLVRGLDIDGNEVQIDLGSTKAAAKVVKMPFYSAIR